MDFLKKELAPISAQGWDFIDGRAEEIIRATLSARKFVSVNGPLGHLTQALPTGKMKLAESNGVRYGVYQSQPLIEQRIHFTLNRWELDNIDRGAKDIDTESMDKAIRQAAMFEEEVIYNGLDDGCILGLKNSSSHEMMSFGTDREETVTALVNAISLLKDSYSPCPYTLVVGTEKWNYLNLIGQDSSFIKRLCDRLNLRIILAPSIENAYLLPFDNENIELTIGGDFALGYQDSNSKEIELFVTSSFTFRVLDGALVIVFE